MSNPRNSFFLYIFVICFIFNLISDWSFLLYHFLICLYSLISPTVHSILNSVMPHLSFLFYMSYVFLTSCSFSLVLFSRNFSLISSAIHQNTRKILLGGSIPATTKITLRIEAGSSQLLQNPESLVQRNQLYAVRLRSAPVYSQG